MADKTPNYTDAMVARLHEVYDPEAGQEARDMQVRALADELGRTKRSIVAKLVRERLYVAKEYKTKKGEKPATKETIVSDIARKLGVDADTTLSGLEKATKNCLLFLHRTVTVFADAAEAENAEAENDETADE